MSQTNPSTTTDEQASSSKDNTTASSTANKAGEATVPTPAQDTAAKGPPSAIEFEPPLACVRRILKNSLPSSTNVGKDASAAFARASGIFIIYLTACANDFARENRRQTITANDVLAAIKELEFDEFTPHLTKFLDHYRELEKSKKQAKAKAKEEMMDEDEEGEEEQKLATPQSMKSKGDDIDVQDGDHTDDDEENDREVEVEPDDEEVDFTV